MRDWDVVVCIARGCGGVKLTTPEGFHAARTSDFEEALEEIRRQRPNHRLYAVGFSLGASITAKVCSVGRCRRVVATGSKLSLNPMRISLQSSPSISVRTVTRRH